LARRKIPCNNINDFRREVADPPVPSIHRSIISVVIDSIGSSPNAGSSCERTIAV
jgi:hypothetical protein